MTNIRNAAPAILLTTLPMITGVVGAVPEESFADPLPVADVLEGSAPDATTVPPPPSPPPINSPVAAVDVGDEESKEDEKVVDVVAVNSPVDELDVMRKLSNDEIEDDVEESKDDDKRVAEELEKCD
jgi:hypothetical protein